MCVGFGFYGTQVLHREGLSADQIGGGFHTHVGDVLDAYLADRGFHAVEVDVAFEGVAAGGFESILAEQFLYPGRRPDRCGPSRW